MLPPQAGSLGAGSPGLMLLGYAGPVTPVDTTMNFGLTYFAMLTLLGLKLPYMVGWVFGLYANPTVFTPSSVASIYTTSGNVPTFAGYAPIPVTAWSAAYQNGLNQILTTAPLAVWMPSNTSTPGPVSGYYVLDAGGNLVGAQANPLGTVTVGATLQPFAVYPSFMEQPIG